VEWAEAERAPGEGERRGTLRVEDGMAGFTVDSCEPKRMVVLEKSK
jgi:hypothetical protein